MKQRSSPSTISKSLSGFFRWIFPHIPKECREQFHLMQTASNIKRMFVFSIYIIVLQIALNIINIFNPNNNGTTNIRLYVTLSLVALSVGVIYFFLFLMVHRNRITDQKTQRFLSMSLLYIYFIIQLAFCTLNIIATGTMNSYIIALLILCLVPMIQPIQSIISILAAFVYVIFAAYFTRNISETWNSMLVSDSWANLTIITLLAIFISISIYNFYVSSFLQSIQLRQSNQSLLDANNQLAALNQKLEAAANVDQVTGILNRRAFMFNYEAAWKTAERNNTKIAVALMDIDYFKSYNDKYGHPAGDKCLQQIAACLQANFRRSSDIVSRYGGEEFLIVFGTKDNDAYLVVEHARKNVEDLCIPHGNTSISPYVTISAGVCAIIPHQDQGVSTNEAIRIADEALYQSKNNGRNQTTFVDHALAAEEVIQ